MKVYMYYVSVFVKIVYLCGVFVIGKIIWMNNIRGRSNVGWIGWVGC